MATLILSTVPARRQGRLIQTIYSLTGAPDPLPREMVEIRTATDAQAAFSAYAERAKATGLGAQASGRLKDGDRAPRGFRALDLRTVVNVD